MDFPDNFAEIITSRKEQMSKSRQLEIEGIHDVNNVYRNLAKSQQILSVEV
jgi:hypothetical protein